MRDIDNHGLARSVRSLQQAEEIDAESAQPLPDPRAQIGGVFGERRDAALAAGRGRAAAE
jgi:hypothetical protein